MNTSKGMTSIISKMQEQRLKYDVLFFIVVTIIGSILYLGFATNQTLISGQPGMLSPPGIAGISVTMMVLFVIDGLAFILVISLVEHFFVLFTDGHRDFEKTMKSVIYASVLPVLFVWTIHNVQYSALVLTAAFLIFTYFGISIFHEITKDRAAFVAIFTTGFIICLLFLGKVNLIS